ncbi:hypothetical protein KBC59_03880 [Patescibacteria group bacterium]|nr:hypothetical protein [Patescibacteria group bacterium]
MNILDFVRAIARTIDRGLGTKVASELVVRLKDGLNRNGRLLEVRRVLGLFTEFVAILALRNSSRYFTELTIGRIREDIARRSQNAWKMALDPEYPTLLRRVITSLTEEEVGRLQRELMEVTIDLSMKQHPEPSTNLFVQLSRGRKGPPN